MTPSENEIRADTSETMLAGDPGRSLPIPANPENIALFLDIDGTLVEIVEKPEMVTVSPALKRRLARLADRLDGAVALVTGRTLADADRLFAGLELPTGAVHGLQRRSFEGSVSSIGEITDMVELRDRLACFAARRAGLLLEDKERSLALHYRAAPEFEAEAEAFIRECLSQRTGISMLHGKMVFEIKPDGADKGAAIEAFMAEAPFRGRFPVFFGDDTTDEHGFAAMRRLGGLGCLVGYRAETEAQYRVADVSAVHEWLDRLLGELERWDTDR